MATTIQYIYLYMAVPGMSGDEEAGASSSGDEEAGASSTGGEEAGASSTGGEEAGASSSDDKVGATQTRPV